MVSGTTTLNRISELEGILQSNKTLSSIFQQLPLLGLPNCFVASGGIAQTVWNALHGFDLTFGIKDYDVIYYDRFDASREHELVAAKKAAGIFQGLGVPIEVVNEANVHMWFEKEFGDLMPRAYTSIEDAISTFSTTAVCVGARYVNGDFDVCAPYGLDDLFGLILRPNKGFYSRKRHEEKINRWKSLWPKLQVIPWEE